MSSIGPAGPGAGGLQQIVALRKQIIDRSEILTQLHAPDAPLSGKADLGGGFSDTLKSALNSVNDAQDKSRSLSEAYERGEVTDVAKVMLARQESGLAFEATLQVRNRLISAYQDIMRMGG